MRSSRGPTTVSRCRGPDAPFGRGDLWILRYRDNEIDDGSVAIGPPYEAQLDQWVNGESVVRR